MAGSTPDMDSVCQLLALTCGCVLVGELLAHGAPQVLPGQVEGVDITGDVA